MRGLLWKMQLGVPKGLNGQISGAGERVVDNPVPLTHQWLLRKITSTKRSFHG